MSWRAKICLSHESLSVGDIPLSEQGLRHVVDRLLRGRSRGTLSGVRSQWKRGWLFRVSRWLKRRQAQSQGKTPWALALTGSLVTCLRHPKAFQGQRLRVSRLRPMSQPPAHHQPSSRVTLRRFAGHAPQDNNDNVIPAEARPALPLPVAKIALSPSTSF